MSAGTFRMRREAAAAAAAAKAAEERAAAAPESAQDAVADDGTPTVAKPKPKAVATAVKPS